ncbi:hypothetical protein [Fischerella sp. FACHB-380]|uniref:hypothetical protein n=1 Tax=Fischerella sp. FACHB-380 TaxID=2692799 RepID=UPI0015E0FE3C|nr:hypothetical protein [Fischerella sp. FACHB-380]MBD2431572.1 hypothetical protein [Fischerella sp. FACHB-380]
MSSPSPHLPISPLPPQTAKKVKLFVLYLGIRCKRGDVLSMELSDRLSVNTLHHP